MALQSKLVFEVEGIEQKSFDVIDSKLVLDRTYDSLSPTGPTHMETLEVTLYPELEDNYFHRWFMEKTKQDVILKILLPSSSRGKELYHHIYLEDAVCYTLFESIERLNDKEEGRRRLLKIGIKAKSVGIRRPKTFKAQAQTQNQAQSKDQKNAKKTTAAKKNQSLEDLLTIRERADKWPGNLSKEEKMKLAENSIEIERSLNIAKGKPMSIEEADEQKANPKRIDPEDSAFVEARDRKYTINCATCSTAYVLRKLGFDVKAKGWVKDTSNSWLSDGNNVFKKWKTVDGQECKMSSFRDWMGEKRVFKMTPELYREFLEEQTQEEGTYILACSWHRHGYRLRCGWQGRSPGGQQSLVRPFSYLRHYHHI